MAKKAETTKMSKQTKATPIAPKKPEPMTDLSEKQTPDVPVKEAATPVPEKKSDAAPAKKGTKSTPAAQKKSSAEKKNTVSSSKADKKTVKEKSNPASNEKPAASAKKEKSTPKTNTVDSAKADELATVPLKFTKKPVTKLRKPIPSKKPEIAVIQSNGNEYTFEDIVERCKAAYRGNGRKQISSIQVYIKFEDGNVRAYYVVNDKAEGQYIEL